MSIITDINVLRQKSSPVTSVTEAMEIISALEKELNNTPNGIGLAACQIGIPKTVGLIKVGKESYTLINPKVIEFSEEFIYLNEGCLSIPNYFIDTKRFRCITIENQIIENNEFRTETHYGEYLKEGPVQNNMIVIAVQHELDHFNGVLISDRKYVYVPIVNTKEKIGRNAPCPCGSGKKYKKCCGK